jgi:hypothetical protein
MNNEGEIASTDFQYFFSIIKTCFDENVWINLFVQRFCKSKHICIYIDRNTREIWSSHDGEYEDYWLLGHDAA